MPSKLWKHGIALAAFAILTQPAIAEQVDNPDYLAWAACKPGATATLKKTSDSFTSIDVAVEKTTETPMIMTRTEQLVEILPDMAVISVSTALGHGKPTTSVVVVLAKIDKDLLPFSTQSPHPNLAVVKLPDVKESKETLEIKGKPIETTRRSLKISVTAKGKTTSTLIDSWKSPDVPGGLVKMVIVVEGKKSLVTEEPAIPRIDTLIDFSKPSVATPRPPEELDDRTPLGMMRMVDRGYLADGDMKKSLSLFHAQTPEGKTLAEPSAASNVSLVLLEKAARDRFGAATMIPEEIDHIIGFNSFSRREVEMATVNISADKAIVTSGEAQVTELVRVLGRWRFDADAGVEGLDPPALKLLVGALNQSTVLANRLTKELNDGKYKTEDEFRKVMVTEMDKITPAEWKKDPAK